MRQHSSIFRSRFHSPKNGRRKNTYPSLSETQEYRRVENGALKWRLVKTPDDLRRAAIKTADGAASLESEPREIMTKLR